MYSNSNTVIKFHRGIRFSNTGCDQDVILEHYLEIDRVNMDTFGEPYDPYFLPTCYSRIGNFGPFYFF